MHVLCECEKIAVSAGFLEHCKEFLRGGVEVEEKTNEAAVNPDGLDDGSDLATVILLMRTKTNDGFPRCIIPKSRRPLGTSVPYTMYISSSLTLIIRLRVACGVILVWLEVCAPRKLVCFRRFVVWL